MARPTNIVSLDMHSLKDRKIAKVITRESISDPDFLYTFHNFFHPFVGELISKLNRESLPGLLDAEFHELELEKNSKHNPAIARPDSDDFFFGNFDYGPPDDTEHVEIKGFPKEIDLSLEGPYANYNWELLFHFPLAIAVHLSKNQRFAEAQRWFHYIFDPSSTDASRPRPERYWKFLRFRQNMGVTRIDELVAILSKPASELNAAEKEQQRQALIGLNRIEHDPFRPHVVASARPVAYQYNVVMKYLDNLFAWGDSLFMQDTIESINEATQLYVLAANILGERPQRIPPSGNVRAMSYKQLKAEGLGPIGNALTDLEHQFPFNSSLALRAPSDSAEAESLFGIGRTLYFCVPRNDKLLGYWDTVADRLFKIRHCMNIEGVVRQLALFDPPLDPGMLVRAAAAGIDVGSIVAGLNQPIGPVRCLFLIQKALELAGEVRGLGGALLSAIEKGDGERLALLRQSHEIKIQGMAKEVRFLQWKQAQESTESLSRSRANTLERYRFYLRVLGQTPDGDAAPDILEIDRHELTEENFDEMFATLVGQYDKEIPLSEYPRFETKQEGRLYLHEGEYAELNGHADRALAAKVSAAVTEGATAILALIPDLALKAAYWGIGLETPRIAGGTPLSAASSAMSTVFGIWAQIEEFEGARASKTASYDRRAQDWILQANLAARELQQIGRQVLGSLIAEQIAHREYQNIQKQIEQSQEVDRLMQEKFSNAELYAWMQGELTRLSYEYYRFAFDTARKAQRIMKHELMRPEVDAIEYIKFNYHDRGRKGLLSGEALYLDVKRMELAYYENNKREYELTKHISLRQLNPLALLALRATGKCEWQVPEWLLDLDCGGHHMCRIKQVSLSIPAVTGPLTGMNCTLTLLRSSLRKSPALNDGYERQGSEDPRFVDYFGAIESIVTSSGDNDGGLFETNLRDERFLPFEGAGAISTWRVELPSDFRKFDYNTISDVVLHVRYTSRQGGDPLKASAAEHLARMFNDSSELALLLDLKHDFPTEWHRFATGTDPTFAASIKPSHFPYFTHKRTRTTSDVSLCVVKNGTLRTSKVSALLPVIQNEDVDFELPRATIFGTAVDPEAEYFLLARYSIG